MRYIFSAILCFIIFSISCKKTNTTASIADGTYTGTFQRLTSTGGQISNVTITFSANNWTGQSEFAKYPALCKGSYTTDSNGNITFENSCPWTAEFDWTLILSRDYKIKVERNTIEIRRDYNNAGSDIYKLTKQ